MNLASHLSDDRGFADLLNYAYLIDDGVLLNKDGAFLVTYRFIGLDLESASGAEWDALTAGFNRLVTGLDDGWMLHIDDVRMPVATYPEPGHFPDAVSALIDTERRAYYTNSNSHYSNAQFLTFVWKFPLPVVKATRHWFVDGLPEGHDDANLSTLLFQFQERVQRCVGLISPYGHFTPLNSAALLRYLHTCISGTHVPIAVPPSHGLVDAALARHPVTGGYVPRVGSAAVTVLSLLGYVHSTTVPGLLEALGTYPLPYRWSNRFIPLSPETAAREIKRYQRHWHNQVKGFSGMVQETIFGSSTPKIDGNAQHLYEQTTEALTLNSQHSTRWGYWTSSVVFIHDDNTVVNAAVTAITRYVEQCGFAVLREDCHAFDAWLGTIPGHGSCHVRRLWVNGWQLAHALPLGSRWTGDAVSDPASLLPPQSPPVFYAQTTGKTPFRFHVDVGDVGHHLVCGPTGSGKSTYLGFLIAQFLRYPHAHIFVFDKDESHKALTHALGGGHVDLGDTESLAFCPLADLTTDRQKARAGQFIEDLVSLQHVVLTPETRTAIYRALESLAHDTQHRNLTVFQAAVQDDGVRKALQYYTIDGPLKSLDAHHDACPWGQLQTFEMQGLLSQKPLVVLPILRTLFDRIEAHLEATGAQYPTLIVLEEAWLYLDHEVFARQLKDWLKTLRKQNARVVFATQSLADLVDPSTHRLTPTTAAIVESCPTKVYLPNPSLDGEMRTLYAQMGLSERQIQIISQEAIPKRDYYVTCPQGSRLIDLGFAPGALPLAFVGLSKTQSAALLRCQQQHGEDWLWHWLTDRGLSHWAAVWRESQRGVTEEEIP